METYDLPLFKNTIISVFDGCKNRFDAGSQVQKNNVAEFNRDTFDVKRGENVVLDKITFRKRKKNGAQLYELFNYAVKGNYVELSRQSGQI